jgi:hypothetical protein
MTRLPLQSGRRGRWAQAALSLLVVLASTGVRGEGAAADAPRVAVLEFAKAPGVEIWKVPTCARTLRLEQGDASVVSALALTEGLRAKVTLTVPLSRCAWARGSNRVSGWTAAAGALVAAVGLGGAYAVHQSFTSTAAGDPGLQSKASLGKALNVAGLAGLGLAVAGAAGLLILPGSAAACQEVTP